MDFRCVLRDRGADAPDRRAGDRRDLAGQEFWPHGRAPQSMAFLSTAGIDRLCSGVTNRTASAAASSALKRTTGFARSVS